MAECKCSKCVDACRHFPGWMTPEEAQKAIEAGYANRLMKDWYSADEDIFILAPASIGHEGEYAPDMPLLIGFGWTKGQCTMLTDDGLCEIHNSGFKPIQCRNVLVCKGRDYEGNRKTNHEVADMWNTELGRSVIETWEKITE